MSDDPFRESQALTERLREELLDVRRDVEAIVRQEVRSAGLDASRVEMLVRDAVRRELRASRPWYAEHARWLVPLAAGIVGIALGLSVFAVLSVRGARRDAVAPASGAVAPADVPAAATLAATRPPPDPPTRAARYDSLLAARSPVFAPLLARIEASGPAPVLAAPLVAWRAGAITAAQRELLHSAFVQLALRDEVDAALVVDGGILRDPCRGASCAAVLELWKTRGAELGLPPYPADSAAVAAGERLVERLLVLDLLESGS